MIQDFYILIWKINFFQVKNEKITYKTNNNLIKIIVGRIKNKKYIN